MEMIKLSIDGVDGTTFFSAGGENIKPTREMLIKFLQDFDHEGSNITVEIYNPSNHDIRTISNPEEAYSELRK